MDALTANLSKVLGEAFLAGIRSMVDIALPGIAPSIRPKLALGKFNIDEHMSAWTEAMDSPASAQYGKSFQRLAGRPITIRDVVAYRDLENVIRSGAAQKALQTDFTLADVDQSDTDAIWDAVDTVTKTADLFAALGSTEQRPTRDAIAKEIKDHKKRKNAKPAAGSVSVAEAREAGVRECITDLCQACGVAAPAFGAGVLGACDEATGKLEGGVSYGEHASKGNLEAFAKCPFPAEWNVPTTYDPAHKDAWTKFAAAIAKSYNLHKMQSSIPPAMMAQIEKQAVAMAAGMENGTMDLSQLNIGSIGESVLKECSTSDLDQLAGNLGNILPNINTLASSLQADSGGELPANMSALLSGAAAMSQ